MSANHYCHHHCGNININNHHDNDAAADRNEYRYNHRSARAPANVRSAQQVIVTIIVQPEQSLPPAVTSAAWLRFWKSRVRGLGAGSWPGTMLVRRLLSTALVMCTLLLFQGCIQPSHQSTVILSSSLLSSVPSIVTVALHLHLGQSESSHKVLIDLRASSFDPN